MISPVRGGRVGIAVLLILIGSGQLTELLLAQGKGLQPVRVAEMRALLIGNTEYANADGTSAQSAVADVRAVGEALQELGFHTTRMENLSADQMDTALESFVAGLQSQDLALFYYSGYALQVGSGGSAKNYLLPVDYEFGSALSVYRKAMAAETVSLALEDVALVRAVVLDASRENPFQAAMGGTDGLAAMQADSPGTLVALATAPGRFAPTAPSGGVGLFAKHFVSGLAAREVELGNLFEQTRQQVSTASSGEQVPAISSSLTGKLFLKGGPARDSSTQRPEAGGDREVSGVSDFRGLSPSQAWERVQDTDSGEVLEAFIERFRGQRGAGVYVVQAEERLNALKDGNLAGEAERQWAAVKDQSERVLQAFVADWETVPGTEEYVQKARARLAELAGPGEPPRQLEEFTNSVGMKFVRIPAGSFRMGSESSLAQPDERPMHDVQLTQGFWMGKHEVKQFEWELIMDSNPSRFKGCGRGCPVQNVSWDAAQAFIRQLNAREAGEGYSYRLPTEAEWEYAARGGTKTDTPAGDIAVLGAMHAPVLDRIGWYGGNSGADYSGARGCAEWQERQYNARRCGPHPVGMKEANAYGLHDMLGNVWEWVRDYYGAYPNGSVKDPKGPRTGATRVYRGGSWGSNASEVRSGNRESGSQDFRHVHLGFRIIRTE